MSVPSTSALSVELLLRVIDVKYGYFTLLFFYSDELRNLKNRVRLRLVLVIIHRYQL